MRRPGVNPENVQMSDVLCDFCHREWTDEHPMIEGHHGACICGPCLTEAFKNVMLAKEGVAPIAGTCPMCLEGPTDRIELGRGDEPGWISPHVDGAVLCRRCIKLGSGALHKDRDYDWTKPTAIES